MRKSDSAVSRRVAGLASARSCVLEEAWLWRLIMQGRWDLMLAELSLLTSPKITYTAFNTAAASQR